MLMKLIYLKSAFKCDSFDVTIGIKIPFLRVLVAVELGRSLLQFVITNCLIFPANKQWTNCIVYNPCPGTMGSWHTGSIAKTF